MIKKVSKVLIALLVVMLMLGTVAPVFAIDPGDIPIDSTNGAGVTQVKTISGQIIGMVQVVGTAVAIIMLIVLGIKYVVAAPEEKAEIKKSAFIYVIAAIFIFGAVNILAMLKDVAETVTDTSKSSAYVVEQVTYNA